jgi:hypothetical protein
MTAASGVQLVARTRSDDVAGDAPHVQQRSGNLGFDPSLITVFTASVDS